MTEQIYWDRPCTIYNIPHSGSTWPLMGQGVTKSESCTQLLYSRGRKTSYVDERLLMTEPDDRQMITKRNNAKIIFINQNPRISFSISPEGKDSRRQLSTSIYRHQSGWARENHDRTNQILDNSKAKASQVISYWMISNKRSSQWLVDSSPADLGAFTRFGRVHQVWPVGHNRSPLGPHAELRVSKMKMKCP